ncbi:LPS-assembly protein LptD [Stakelama pacifica]|uniref:LPS-assembly protein LptD n=1 Tax=Stakelama pacifica TaxID=517720 RepID=A0A4R6FXP4_9SPHN|nr:LPS assembly protein LptD [Stakelama pacifica]TDN86766.1 LPS-assembly protein [Stakelama pacifica]GGO90608.1 LPS-assembly protein LptD [Stakelama pacifica]
MTRKACLLSCAVLLPVLGAIPAHAQDLGERPAAPPAPEASAAPATDDQQIAFSAETLEYDSKSEIVTASGDVHLSREGNRLRADKVVWNRKTGQVVATGNIAATNPQGDIAYGDQMELTDALKGGAIENMLVVLDQGGRLAARDGNRDENGVITVNHAAYTGCSVTDSAGCPKEPSWKITARKVVYNPQEKRIRYSGATLQLFGMPVVPLPSFSHPVGGESDSGLLAPSIRYDRVNGFEAAVPYFISFAPDRDLTITPHLFSDALPMLQAEYRELNDDGAFRVTGYLTYSRQADDRISADTQVSSDNKFRGYIDGSGTYQFTPNWSASASIRVASDQTFLRRYDISRVDRLRNNLRVERIDRNSYFAINGWAVQTLRPDERQGLQPIALPEIDYRRRISGVISDGVLNLQLNSLAITRTAGQDTQRAFASAEWDLRRITPWGQEVTLTAYARGDIYHTSDILATDVVSYRGKDGFQGRAIAAVAVDVKWPFVGTFLSGTQRLTPRVQMVASPPIRNLDIPNEDARAVDLEDSNLFALNRFPGYDRFEDSTRFTYGFDWAITLPGLTIDATAGQSYRLSSQASILPDGTGFTDRFSDFVGRTEIRYRDFVALTHRYRLDKDNLAIRRNEIDATIGSRKTYLLLGYLRLNRNITADLEDLRDREEARVGGRVAFAKFWSVYGSATIDLTDAREDPISRSDGFEPVRHRLGLVYEDDCLKLGVSWRRYYQDTGDARRGNSYLLTLSLKNLGR